MSSSVAGSKKDRAHSRAPWLAGGHPPAWLLVVTGLACGFGVFLTSFTSLLGSVSRWSAFTSACREGVLLPALILSFITYALGRGFSPTNVVVGRGASRGSGRIWLRYCAALTIATLIGYTIGLAPLAVKLSLRASWGNPDLLALLDAFAVLGFLVVFDMALAIVFHGRWGVLIIPVITAVTVCSLLVVNEAVLVNSGHSSLLFSSVWNDQSPVLGYQITTVTHLLRILFFAMLALLSARISIRVLDGERATGDPASWVIAVATSGALLFSVLASPALFSRVGFSPDCSATPAGATLCLHPADDAVRDEIVPIVDRVARLTSTQRSIFVEYVSGSDPTNGKGKGFYIAVDGKGNVDENALVTQLSGEVLMPDGYCGDDNQDASGAAFAVYDELNRRLGVGGVSQSVSDGESLDSSQTVPGAGFRQMSDKQFTAWISTHAETIRTCTIQENDLP